MPVSFNWFRDSPFCLTHSFRFPRFFCQLNTCAHKHTCILDACANWKLLKWTSVHLWTNSLRMPIQILYAGILQLDSQSIDLMHVWVLISIFFWQAGYWLTYTYVHTWCLCNLEVGNLHQCAPEHKFPKDVYIHVICRYPPIKLSPNTFV